jgi:putative acetyltransferase
MTRGSERWIEDLTSRPAAATDAHALFELRRRSILQLAPEGMPVDRVRVWAEKGSIESMCRRLEETDAWVAEDQGRVVGWVAVRDDYLDALYVDPDHARRGIGRSLLLLAETVLRQRGVAMVRADASPNSEAFYLRHGYEPIGPRPRHAARPMRKRLLADPG